jgi:hypothetical protein
VRTGIAVGLALTLLGGVACDEANQGGSPSSPTRDTAPVVTTTRPPFAGGPNPTSNVDGGNGQQPGGAGHKGRRPTTTTVP